MEGLFGNEVELYLPEKAHQALQGLADVRAKFAASSQRLTDESTPAPHQELVALWRNAQEMTAIAEAQINKVIQACKRGG